MMSTRPPQLPPRRDSVPDIISLLPYYHPYLTSMEQVKQVIMPYIQDEGSFLLRNSISKKGFYTISVVHHSGIKHFNVERASTSTAFYLKDIQFSTLDDLVKYYAYTDVPNKELIRGVRLKHPIPRAGMRRPSAGDNEDPENPDVYIHPEEKREDRPPMLPPMHPAPPPPTSTPGGGYGKRVEISSSMRLPDTEKRSSAIRRTQTLPAAVIDESGYTSVNSLELERPHAHEMIREMQRQDDDSELCECGLPKEKSGLPRGWSIHLSQDDDTRGEVYFMSSDRKTAWTLPLSVCLELDADQQDFIRDRIHEYEQRTKRTARAKMTLAGDAAAGIPSSVPVATPGEGGYIKASQPTTKAPAVAVSQRPVTLFPPAIAAVSVNRSSSRCSNEPNVQYMDMNGIRPRVTKM